MRKQDVVVGATYLMNHSSGKIKVTIRREIEYNRVKSRGPFDKGRTIIHWEALNHSTGRLIEIKSATKLTKI